MTLLRRTFARTTSDDSGFSLIELVVAMLVIAIVLTSLIGVQLSSLKTVALAKQRQSATALADQKVERLRSLPYDKLGAGLLDTDAAVDAGNIAAGRLRAPWDELVVTSTNQTEPELNPHVKSERVGGTTYTVRTFVTLPKTAAGDSTNANDFWLTVIVEWSSSATGGKTKSVVVRNREVFPAGCAGTVDHPYVGPCQAFLLADAGTTTAGITIRSADPSGGQPIAGIPFSTANIVLPTLTSGSEIEQTTSARAEAVTGGIVVDNAQISGQAATTAVSDIDPVTGATINPTKMTMLPSASIPYAIPGNAGVLSLTPAGATGGHAVAEVSSVADPACQDLSGVAVPNGQLCAAARYQGDGFNRADLDLQPVDGVDLGSIELASVQAGASPSGAFGSRFPAGKGTLEHCTGTTEDGCTAAGASRTFGDIRVGGLPAGALPTGFDGMLKLSNYSDSATSEAGDPSPAGAVASPATGGSRFQASRAGQLLWWAGSGYTSVDLNTLTSNASYAMPAITVTYGPSVNVTVSGEARIAAPSTAESKTATCQPDACTGKSSAGSVIASMTYKITSASGTIAHFVVDVNLGSVVANTTYRAVPNA